MKRILFVCTGNTCRSPMCAALFNALYAEKLSAAAFSAGLMADSSPISKNASEALAERGIISDADNAYADHVSHTVTESDAASAEAIYGVSESHAAQLRKLFPQYESKIFSLPISIDDPYGMDKEAYRRCLCNIGYALDLLFGDTSGEAVSAADISMLGDILAAENESFTCPWSEKSFIEAFESKNITVYAAKDEHGALAGFSCLLVIGTEAEILNIAVPISHRRMGYADKLMRKMLADCSARCVEAVFLEVRSSNSPAQALYEKHGFIRLGVRRKYYTNPIEDAVLMKKLISQE